MGRFGIPVGFLSFYGQAQPTQRGLEELIDLFCSYHQPLPPSQKGVGNSAGFHCVHFFSHWLRHLQNHRLNHWTFWNRLLSMAWISSSFGNQKLDTGCKNFVQIYLGGCCIQKRKTGRKSSRREVLGLLHLLVSGGGPNWLAMFLCRGCRGPNRSASILGY